jgi:hypothetical protein
MFEPRICTIGGEYFIPEWSYEKCCKYHSQMRTQQNLHDYADCEIEEYRIRGVLHTCPRCGAEIPYYVWLCLPDYITYTGHQPVWSAYLADMLPTQRPLPDRAAQPRLPPAQPRAALPQPGPQSSPITRPFQQVPLSARPTTPARRVWEVEPQAERQGLTREELYSVLKRLIDELQ